jgi:hypothetical protein
VLHYSGTGSQGPNWSRCFPGLHVLIAWPNDQDKLPGRLQRRYRSKSRDAGPVNFIDWLSGESRGISRLSTYQFLEAPVGHALGIEDRIVGIY